MVYRYRIKYEIFKEFRENLNEIRNHRKRNYSYIHKYISIQYIVKKENYKNNMVMFFIEAKTIKKKLNKKRQIKESKQNNVFLMYFLFTIFSSNVGLPRVSDFPISQLNSFS